MSIRHESLSGTLFVPLLSQLKKRMDQLKFANIKVNYFINSKLRFHKDQFFKPNSDTKPNVVLEVNEQTEPVFELRALLLYSSWLGIKPEPESS